MASPSKLKSLLFGYDKRCQTHKKSTETDKKTDVCNSTVSRNEENYEMAEMKPTTSDTPVVTTEGILLYAYPRYLTSRM